ncbi:MAG: hypothetical protein RSA65_05085, partial [Clostridia bacterium]
PRGLRVHNRKPCKSISYWVPPHKINLIFGPFLGLRVKYTPHPDELKPQFRKKLKNFSKGEKASRFFNK